MRFSNDHPIPARDLELIRLRLRQQRQDECVGQEAESSEGLTDVLLGFSEKQRKAAWTARELIEVESNRSDEEQG